MARTNAETRPYQQRIITKAIDYFCNSGHKSVLIESPTGSGKSFMALVIVKLLQERLGLRAGWVAMRRNLLAQAKAENERRNIGADLKFISMFDKEPPVGLDILVLDECHHEGASSMMHLYNVIQPRFSLGLSGTPYRTDRIKLTFEQIIRDAGIARLVEDSYLSAYRHFTLPTYSPESVAEFYIREPQRWGRSLAYFHTLEQAYRADSLLKDWGIRSDVVTGSSDREAQIAAFRDGRFDVLLNCMVLSEGFDMPELQTVFARPSCKGLTVQMCGRVLRKHPAVPVKQIVQCTKTPWPFPRTASACLQFTWVDGNWRSLQPNPHLCEINHRVMRALAHAQVELPKVLVARPTRRRGRQLLPGTQV
jgi:superfamily II DNA or RNA helicase